MNDAIAEQFVRARLDATSLPDFPGTIPATLNTAYAYQDRVLNAGREVEDGMVAFLRSQEQAEHLKLSADAAARTVEITEAQYNQGAVDFTAVYLFQSTLTEQQDQLAVSRGDVALGLRPCHQRAS